MEYEPLPDWARTSKQTHEILRRMRRNEIIKNVLIAVLVIGCFLAAGYSDNQALALGLIH